jgi:hypothetical protein
MKTIRPFLAALLICTAVCQAQEVGDDSRKFLYRPERNLPVGTVLHYLKTNIDGTRPEYVSQFIAARDVMEAFKFHQGEPPAGLVVAEMDWRTFSARTLKSWRVLSKTERQLFGTITFDARARRAEVSLPAVRQGVESFAFRQLPVHLYNFDFGSLNFAFPHLARPERSFTIGVVDPTFEERGPMVEYKGEVTVSYERDERRNDVATRKYRVDGAGLKNRGGFIWVNKKRGWIEDMEIALPDNPAWTSFKLRLLRVEKMSRAEWDSFMAQQL